MKTLFISLVIALQLILYGCGERNTNGYGLGENKNG
jgi:hypothetical protein